MDYGRIAIYGIISISTLFMFINKKEYKLIPYIFIFLIASFLEINILYNNLIYKYIISILIVLSTYFSVKTFLLENYKSLTTLIILNFLLFSINIKYIKSVNFNEWFMIIPLLSFFLILNKLLKIRKIRA